MGTRTPTWEDVGNLPRRPIYADRPVGSYSLAPLDAGVQALERGGERLGEGIEKGGAALAEVQAANDRDEFTAGYSSYLTKKADLENRLAQDNNYGPDADGKTLPQRYQAGVTQIRTDAMSGIRARG